MMAKYPPGKDNFLSRENKRLERENKQLQSQLAEAERGRDLLASSLRFVTPFNPGPELFEQLSSANEQLKRREWVRAIRYAVNKLERPDVPLAPSMILNDDLRELAKRIESGDVEL